MDYISSQSTSDGRLKITVIFKVGTDPDTALLLTRSRVEDTLSRLPEAVRLQGVQVKKTIPALLLAVHVYSPDGSRSAEYMSNYRSEEHTSELQSLMRISYAGFCLKQKK